MKRVLMVTVAVLVAMPALADEVDRTMQEQIRSNSDATQAARLALTRQMDQNKSLRTHYYYRCITDDGYGRWRLCSAGGNENQ
jgi:hypothetical protein